jgi:hypothetical protein
MATFRHLLMHGRDGWYLMSPRGPIEALRIAWMLWRHPHKIAALVGVDQEFVLLTRRPGPSADPPEQQMLPALWIGAGQLREVVAGNAISVYAAPDRDRFADVPMYDRVTLDASVAAERERMRALIADDASAITHQSLGQYRTALLRALRA